MAKSEWQEGIKEGYCTKVIQVGNCVVTVHRPINLTNEERKKLEYQVRISMLNLVAEKETSEEEKSA